MEKTDILKELSHKSKNVSDLIRYIKNVTPYRDRKLTPNFSILLGSGASVSSGVRSGETLVKEWKKDVLSSMPGVIIGEDLEKTWNENVPEWYDSSNSYSSLFEHQYDLQRQRRIFVENEVSEKDPSIGYAYLVRLISSNYFNTVFTTNFDDLLNEAFYRFSTIRPMVCAHDSSISGVTVTSERPKIIKLHGDYLFDNIKTTMRETESLETNMRMKFKEFARDFGLIVVGYSGQDRSIMDILSYLLDQESYFKNGIYWCVRKGTTEISNELKKLLWKDRVYFVEIDGFDELMAELNNSLNEGHLPVDDTYFGYAHQEYMIKKLIDNQYLRNTSSLILKSDMDKIKNRVKSTKIDDFINFLKEERADGNIKTTERNRPTKRIKLTDITAEQKEILYKINDTGLIKHSTREAISIIESQKPFEIEDSQYKLELLKHYVDYIKKGDDAEIKKYADEIIRLNPDDERHYIIASRKSIQFSQGYDYLKKAISLFENDYYIHNTFADYILDYSEDNFLDDSKQKYIDEAICSLKKSISLYKSVENDAYIQIIRAYKLKYSNEKETKDKKIKEIKDTVSNMSTTDIVVLRLKICTNDNDLSEDTFMSYINFYMKADSPDKVESVVIEYVKWLQEKGEYIKINKVMDDYESNYSPSEKYLGIKAICLMNNEEFEKSLEIIDSIPLQLSLIKGKMNMLYYMGKDKELDNFYNSLPKSFDVDMAYYSAKRDDENIIQMIEHRNEQLRELSVSDLIALSFSYLKTKRYSEAVSLLKPYYDNPKMKTGEIIVNYLFAKYNGNKTSLSRKASDKILDNDYVVFSDDVLGIAYHFMSNEDKAMDFLAKEIKLRPSHKYEILYWPVLHDMKDNKRFKTITRLKYNREVCK